MDIFNTYFNIMQPKFILTDTGHLRLGMVYMHKDLLLPGESCLGGGYYEFDYINSRLLLSGKSYDFGRPKWNFADAVIVPEVYRGLTIVYSPDRDWDGELPLADYVELRYEEV